MMSTVLKDPAHGRKLVYGIGINDADYSLRSYVGTGKGLDGRRNRRKVWACPIYAKWVNMLCRCYSAGYQDLYPSYRGCSVTPEWLRFSVFKEWMDSKDWHGKELDKDLLVPGNKLYSPSTCCFISPRLNSFISERDYSEAELPIGVTTQANGTFRTKCRDMNRKQVSLGTYQTKAEAHEAWRVFKLEMAKKHAALENNPAIYDAIVRRYENYGSL